MDSLMSLRIFCSVAELRSFTAAADRHGMSTTMASKHVRALESRLGTRLLNRTSRHVSLTEAGALYFNQATQTLEGLDEVEAAVSNTTMVPRGTLRLAAPLWFDNRSFSAMLARYSASYPEVRLDIELTGRAVNLVEEGYDLVLRATVPEELDAGLIARPLVDMPFQLVATSGYLDSIDRPQSLAELEGRELLVSKRMHFGTSVPFDTPSGREVVRFRAGLETGNQSLLRLLAQEGIGMALLPDLMIEDDVEAGRLERVLPGVAQVVTRIFAIYPSRRFLSAKVRTFIDTVYHEIQRINQERERRSPNISTAQ